MSNKEFIKIKKDLKKFKKGIDKRQKLCYNKSIKRVNHILKSFKKKFKKSY